MKKYTIYLSDIVALWDIRELTAEDVGVAYIIRELWDENWKTLWFTKEDVVTQYPYFSESFDNLVAKGIITEIEL